jgi:hypothetical protein
MFERVIPIWHAEGYTQEVLEKVLYRNAEAYFPAAAASGKNASDVEIPRGQVRVG